MGREVLIALVMELGIELTDADLEKICQAMPAIHPKKHISG